MTAIVSMHYYLCRDVKQNTVIFMKLYAKSIALLDEVHTVSPYGKFDKITFVQNLLCAENSDPTAVCYDKCWDFFECSAINGSKVLYRVEVDGRILAVICRCLQ